MMDWTDRHCRRFHRAISAHVLLYTEMVTDRAVIHGDRDRLLGFDPVEHPVALQLGGSDPALLAEAARIGADWGHDEINLNCGCPSDRVQSGCFGAVLMERPAVVADCVAAMRAVVDIPVTVKCRIGVDAQDPREALPRFLEIVSAAGATRFVIHARKAWLQGLSPKENREVPPLDHPLVAEMKQAFSHLAICLNGGITTLEQVVGLLEAGLDGVMVGRAAYHQPMDVLGAADLRVWGEGRVKSPVEVVEQMLPYIEQHLANGGRLHQVTRHMLGLFAGRPGARAWRRELSTGAVSDGAGLEVLTRALAAAGAGAAAA